MPTPEQEALTLLTFNEGDTVEWEIRPGYPVTHRRGIIRHIFPSGKESYQHGFMVINIKTDTGRLTTISVDIDNPTLTKLWRPTP